MNIDSFIGTLATGSIIGAATLWVSGNEIIVGKVSGNFTKIASTDIAGVQLPVIYMLVAMLVLGFVLEQTVFGRRVYASGYGPEVSRLVGLRVGRIRTLSLLFSGLVGSFAGIALASRIGSADPSVGPEYLRSPPSRPPSSAPPVPPRAVQPLGDGRRGADDRHRLRRPAPGRDAELDAAGLPGRGPDRRGRDHPAAAPPPGRRLTAPAVALAPGPLLDGRTAIVTGGAAGIGGAISAAFVAHGARVLAVDRDAAALARLGAGDGARAPSDDAGRRLAERVGAGAGAGPSDDAGPTNAAERTDAGRLEMLETGRHRRRRARPDRRRGAGRRCPGQQRRPFPATQAAFFAAEDEDAWAARRASISSTSSPSPTPCCRG